jgi:hypothetical protein
VLAVSGHVRRSRQSLIRHCCFLEHARCVCAPKSTPLPLHREGLPNVFVIGVEFVPGTAWSSGCGDPVLQRPQDVVMLILCRAGPLAEAIPG